MPSVTAAIETSSHTNKWAGEQDGQDRVDESFVYQPTVALHATRVPQHNSNHALLRSSSAAPWIVVSAVLGMAVIFGAILLLCFPQLRLRLTNGRKGRQKLDRKMVDSARMERLIGNALDQAIQEVAPPEMPYRYAPKTVDENELYPMEPRGSQARKERVYPWNNPSSKWQDPHDHSRKEELDITQALSESTSNTLLSTQCWYSGSQTNLLIRARNISTEATDDDHPEYNVKKRPRQGSDASTVSQETNVSDIEDFPFEGSSTSSVTSLSSEGGYAATDTDDDACEMTFEVRRARSLSVKVKKGVLVAWQVSQSNHGSKTDRHAAEWHQNSSEYCVDDLDLSCSLSASDTRVPYLVVTKPSCSSLSVSTSGTSSISVNLNDFPPPPECTTVSAVKQFVTLYETLGGE